MIIYGHRPREKVVAEGEFTCPHCQVRRPYQHKRLIRYLTLFFIPTIPLGRLAEKVECQVCFTYFPPDAIFRPADGQGIVPPTIRPPRTQTRRGWLMVILGALGFLLAAGFALFVIIFQLTNPAGPRDNLQGFVGILVICPLPLGLVSLGVIGWGGSLVWKVRKAWANIDSPNPTDYNAP